MIYTLVGYISGFLVLISFVPYIRDVLRGRTKPERISWLLWALLGTIALFSQFAEGASRSLLLTAVQALGDVAVFALSVKLGIGGFLKRDVIALAVAGASLVLWYITKEPLIALGAVIIIDWTGGVLTIIKSYESPSTETMSTWMLTCVAGFFAAVSVGELNAALLLFPVHIFLVNLAVVIAIQLGQRKILYQQNV